MESQPFQLTKEEVKGAEGDCLKHVGYHQADNKLGGVLASRPEELRIRSEKTDVGQPVCPNGDANSFGSFGWGKQLGRQKPVDTAHMISRAADVDLSGLSQKTKGSRAP